MTPTEPDAVVGCGDVVGPVQVGPIAHGGHCVARYHGRVIFTRHALPGERVMITLTAVDRGRFWRGDATEIIEPSPDRVQPVCEIAGPGGCGGCDFQHVRLAAQRRLKAQVLSEQLHRLAGIDADVEVEAPDSGDAPINPDGGFAGFGWRTRMRYRIDEAGRAGLHAYRSDRIVPLPQPGCRIAHPALARPQTGDAAKPPDSDLIGVHTGFQTHWFSPGPAPAVTQHAIGRAWHVPGDGFWQVHPRAPELLAGAVLDGLAPQAGESALDLYCGVGLFAGALADAGCRVTAVEGSRSAVAAALDNLADDNDRARCVQSRVDRAMSRPRGRGSLPSQVDLIVLDPPRSGAGRKVISQISRRSPRAIAYVACDPAALARDLGYLAGYGYRPGQIRAFDLFPMTQHLETVAVLLPEQQRHRRGPVARQ
jgi:tRNA/tmRNA/rRNA uracil-C5-methylase (TrmA/RlmC/RlmD family)